jgi:hypothetical protein
VTDNHSHHDVATGRDPVRGLWLDTTQHEQLLAALTVAADRASDDLGCVACDEHTCTSPAHREPAATIRQWRGLAQQLTAVTFGTGAAPPAVVFDSDYARAWLRDGAAEEFGIDESFSTTELTIAGGLEDLLIALADNAEPAVWTIRAPLTGVLLWRTADGDGVDGGAVLTADLRFGNHQIRLATRHRAYDEFVDDAATSGIDAAVEALGTVADLVNREVAALLAATAADLPHQYTVVGVWQEDQPIPVGVIAGEHPVHDGDATAFAQGLWATSVTAPDSTTAQQLAVAEMRAS